MIYMCMLSPVRAERTTERIGVERSDRFALPVNASLKLGGNDRIFLIEYGIVFLTC